MSDITTFIDELAGYIATELSLNFKTVPGGEKRQVFTYRMDRETADDVASVLRLTGGPASGSERPAEIVTVQCRTQSISNELGAFQRAWAIYELFMDSDRLAKNNIQLTNWLMLSIDALQKPAAIGMLEPTGGADVVFNWIINAVPAAA